VLDTNGQRAVPTFITCGAPCSKIENAAGIARPKASTLSFMSALRADGRARPRDRFEEVLERTHGGLIVE
jgi:hypothetical protein